MIAYIDIEHISLSRDNERWQARLGRVLKVKYRLEAISGLPCLIMRYEQVSPARLDELGIRAVLISGSATELPHYGQDELAGMTAMFHQVSRPTFGFCGGQQMMAHLLGARVAPINETESGTMATGGWQERTHELGFTAVKATGPHHLLSDLSPDLQMFEAHYWELKEIPAGFHNYASSAVSPIQFIAHETLPLFGTQFHPEAFDEAHPDGQKMLANFFQLL
ncbi:MAG: gamma-glutamyl-gamma-aminobutyrate hydrolase family protein [Anaerolineales bacterium]|nr:gamma-glutamyl-gamma-aminobutyrate hydrolase family protein [Anaerolineales bacterium]